MNKQINLQILEQVKHILDKNNFKYTIDKKSNTLAEILSTYDTIYDIYVVISKKVIKESDNFHPERLVCILINKQKIIHFIRNNRVLDLEILIPFCIKNNIDPSDNTCVVCLSEYTVLGFICEFCQKITCKKCYKKIEIDGAYHCPICRKWNLTGPGFGIPHNTNIDIPIDLHPIDQFMVLLKMLDGEITIFVAIKNTVEMDNVIVINKLSYTSRYVQKYNKPAYVIKLFKILLKEYNTIQLLMIRKLFTIDQQSNKPLCEISKFLLSNKTFYQYDNDVWHCGIFEMLFSESIHIKTEYIKPHNVIIPNHLIELYKEINQYVGQKTIIVVSKKEKTYKEISVINGVISQPVKNIMTFIEDINYNCYICCYMHKDTSLHHFDMTTYKISKKIYTKTSIPTSKNLNRKILNKHVITYF